MSSNSGGHHLVKGDPKVNPNALHDFHLIKRGPKGVPEKVTMASTGPSQPKDPGHLYAKTQHVSFDYFDQQTSNAPFGYEHFVSLPPSYNAEEDKLWPLILFLHGSGESQRNENESFLSIRHGIPKIILCYDKLRSDGTRTNPSVSIPRADRLKKSKQTKQGDKSEEPVPTEVCTMVAESFVTVTPSLNMLHGYGWNASILSALLDEVVDRYRVDVDRIHVTGFSMGGYGTWALAVQTPNRFASLMPICGGGDHLRVTHIKHIPQWVHHGDLDDIIPVKASEMMVDALHMSGAPEVTLTRYPELLHDSWTEAYNNIKVYEWMLATKRSIRGEEKAVSDENKELLLTQG